LQNKFNELLITDWNNTKGQIAFCTFHQSFSYEDFVEGIKPKTENKQVTYEVEPGIFKNICKHAVAIVNAQKDNLLSLTQAEFNQAVFYKLSLGDTAKEEGRTIYDYCIKNNVISIGFGQDQDLTNKTEEDINAMVTDNLLDTHAAQSLNYFKNYLKVGNFVVISNGNNYIRAIGKVTGEYRFEDETEIGWDHVRSVEWLFSNVDIPVNEFYQNGLSQKTIYKLKKEFIIPSFFVKAEKNAVITNHSKNFVLIIDEINRGNVSSIFGELITLIEPTKRAGQPEALEVVLPYSKTPFTVPSNVYLVGTMNTADRSIESLDTALRRRFSFKEMAPKSGLIVSEGKSKGVIDGIDLVKMLDKMNDRIEKLIDKDHKIGHSYFISISTIKELQHSFKDKVIPLLEEYFFGDFGKIGLVLGNSFVKKEANDFEFAKFEDYDSQTEQDLKQRAIFTIKPVGEWNFKSIYE
jgi:5-methylcytosine-specific restriction protein B